MLLRTEGDFIRAANSAYDLAGIVTTYLTLWRKHINGFNGVTVPKHEFAITFTPPKREGVVTVSLHWTDHHTYTETLYYDTDSDYFSEAWGADNSYGTTSHTEDYAASASFNIPITHLMMSEVNMEKFFLAKKAKIAEDKAEAARVARIAALRAELEAELEQLDAQVK